MALNVFFAAKYGLFASDEMQRNLGFIEYNRELICSWESPAEVERLWALAMLYLLFNGVLGWEEIWVYRRLNPTTP